MPLQRRDEAVTEFAVGVKVKRSAGAKAWSRVLSELAQVRASVEWDRPTWRLSWQDGPTREALMGRAALGEYRVGAPLPFEDLRFARSDSAVAIPLAWLARGTAPRPPLLDAVTPKLNRSYERGRKAVRRQLATVLPCSIPPASSRPLRDMSLAARRTRQGRARRTDSSVTPATGFVTPRRDAKRCSRSQWRSVVVPSQYPAGCRANGVRQLI